MKILHVSDLDQYGIILDSPGHNLPPNAWTGGSNVRFTDGSVEKMRGREQVLGTLLGAPYALFPLRLTSGYLWFYAGLNDIWCTDGNNHDEASKSSGVYSSSADIGWNGGQLSGGVLVLNNGVDTPQQWNGTAYTDNFSDLTGWPSGMIARVIRPFKQHLIALDIDEGSGRNPQLLRMSSLADPGLVPSSWDYTDPTKLTLRTTVGDKGDVLMDAVPLRDNLIIYASNSTHIAQYVGGNKVMTFRKLFDQIGAMSRRCAKPFLGNHFVLSHDDAFYHDGVTPHSVLTRRWRRWLSNRIDASNFERSFVAVNYGRQEVWMCYPATGDDYPTEALVWNWETNTISVVELGGFADAAYGSVDATPGSTFDDATAAFDSAVGIFDEQYKSALQQQMVWVDTTNSKLLLAERTQQYDGSDFYAYVEHSALPFGNYQTLYPIKTVFEVRPRIEGTTGGTVNLYIGTRNYDGDSVEWHGPYPYIIGSTRKINCRASGRIISIRFDSSSNIEWKLSAYEVGYRIGGLR